MDNDVSHFVAEQLLSLDARITALEEAGGGKPPKPDDPHAEQLPADDLGIDFEEPAPVSTSKKR